MLSANTRLLWKEGEIEVTVAKLSSELETALRNAHNANLIRTRNHLILTPFIV